MLRAPRSSALAAAAVLLCSSAAAACSRSTSTDISGAPYSLVANGSDALCPVHDPSIAREGSSLYLFSTDAGGPPSPPFLFVRRSDDNGTTWRVAGHIFDALPAWALAAVPDATNIWAPEVAIFNGLVHVYYAISSFGSPVSVIGLATSPSLASPVWTDRGLVLASSASDDFNAIDPSLLADDGAGQAWMSFGSFWSGIKAVRIDAATGLVDARNSTVIALAERPAPDALEGSFLVRRGGSIWLFASFDYCCRGAKSTYNVRVGRSTSGVEGPFLDRAGTPLMAGGGTPLVAGGFGWAAGGGQGLLRESVSDGAGSEATMVLHAYDGESGDPFVQLVRVRWDDATDGWPVLLVSGAAAGGGEADARGRRR